MPTRPSVRQLECIVAVADTLHFGRAAKRCAVTQPALSAQVQLLEDLLGVQVFERSRRRVIVTPVGAGVVAQARLALEKIDDVADVARAAGRPLVGELRLGVIPTIAPYLLPRVLPAVRRAWPELELVLREDQTARLVERLLEGKLDLLLLALPVEEARLEEAALYREPFVLVTPEGHPLAGGRTRRVAETDLERAEVLLLEEGHCLRAQALSVCDRAGARETGRIQATSLPTLVQMVANGLGVSLLPQLALDLEVRGPSRLAVRRFREPPPGRTVGLAWRPESVRSEEFHLLAELLRQRARALLDKASRSKSNR